MNLRHNDYPDACVICGRLKRGHGDVYTSPGGAHFWTRPDPKTILARLRNRAKNRPPLRPARRLP